MTTTNDITGDSIKTKNNSSNYRDNYDKIFTKNREDNKGKSKENSQ